MKPCTCGPVPDGWPAAHHLCRTEAVRIAGAALEEQLQASTQSYEGMAGAVVDALHDLGALPLAEDPALFGHEIGGEE